VPNHVYYEGYFHALRDPRPSWSVNPRLGSDFLKPAAGVRLRAFLELMRRATKPALETALRVVGAANRSAMTCLRLVQEGRHFADCAVQLHHGDAVEPPQRLGWHADAPNSLVHMAISLHGAAALAPTVIPNAAFSSCWRRSAGTALAAPASSGRLGARACGGVAGAGLHLCDLAHSL
jgi:hypothetical protein